jgi:predicted RNA methylase
MELKNFKEIGDDGEVWFGKEVQKKTVEFILDKYKEQQDLTEVSVLDVGTGNGAFLFKLV